MARPASLRSHQRFLPTTTGRVPASTPRHVNERIRRQTERRVFHTVADGQPAIDARLAALDREWDIERAIEANAATVAAIGLVIGAFHWVGFLLTGLVAAFLLQHALQGWCPPVPALRRLGFRTSREIELERHALKLVRGDYAVPPARTVDLAAVQAAVEAAGR